MTRAIGYSISCPEIVAGERGRTRAKDADNALTVMGEICSTARRRTSLRFLRTRNAGGFPISSVELRAQKPSTGRRPTNPRYDRRDAALFKAEIATAANGLGTATKARIVSRKMPKVVCRR